MRFTIDKPKIKKGLSYALQTSTLKNAIDETGLDCNIDLKYSMSKKIPAGETILECFYWLPNEDVDYDRFYIRAGTVNSEDRKMAQELLREKVIPKFIDWVKKIKSLPLNSTKLKDNMYFNAVFINNNVKIFQE